ncbi:MAG: rhomboid family intramembrane serine protease [Blastocatellia bacterium]
MIEASARTCPLCGRDSVPPARISSANIAASGNFFSLVILTINIVLFVLMSIVEVRNGGSGEAFIKSASGGVLDDFGALVPSLAKAGQWWRLVTFNFLHIGLMHLMFNSSALFSIGPQVEGIFGSQKFVFAYIGTGIASGVASVLFLPAGTAGASGAIFGLIGLMAVYGYRLGGSFGRGLMRQMLIWAGIGIVFGYFIGANNVAHVGGFLAGAGLGFMLAPGEPSTVGSAARWNAAAIACIGVVAISFVMAGRVYGAEQEKSNQREVAVRQAKRAMQLAETVAEARDYVDGSFDPSLDAGRATPDERVEVALALRRIAGELEKAPIIDDRSTEIKKRLIELINNRAKVFDQAPNHRTMAAADRDALDVAFRDFADWENDAVQKFQRLFER